VIPPSELKDVIEQASIERMEVCNGCPLLFNDKVFGKRCNSQLYINPNTNETSKFPSKGMKRGCGCILSAKTRCLSCSCPANKWTSINVKEE
jgi:hypothetical protein